ncbi:DAN domain protein [Onchocerca flexuosa]|uniref:DAN domain protein n=1 Tax=Onchocerca flexuosa TaxID=387005 RepID=A0A238BYF7_9BILA|nr:DAN domain protein [Onchocerca flexuosa]
MRIGIIGRAFIDRPSRSAISLLLKSMVMLISSNYLLLPADGTPIVNIGVVEQSPTTSSAGYIQYKVENGSVFDEIAKKAFISLHSEPYIEPPLLTFDQKRLKWLQRYMRKQLKAEKKDLFVMTLSDREKQKYSKIQKPNFHCEEGKAEAKLPLRSRVTDSPGKKVLSSPKEALHQVNQEVSLGRLDDSRPAAHCDGQIFKQRIRMDGCLSKVVHNRFCHGTCSSYFIPRLRPRKLKLDAMFQSCSVCRPTEWDTVEVKLDCPRKNPKELKRKVIKVKKCKCIALNGNNLESEEDVR